MSLLSRLAVRAARAYGMLAGGVSTSVSADYLVVAGGGGAAAGGGGAGGYQTSTTSLSTLNTYSITVGAGGKGALYAVVPTSGSNSSISGTGLSTITSIGGGGAGGTDTTPFAGQNGGSGGGAAGDGRPASGGTGTSGQGNNGGSNSPSNPYPGGGGGGAGAVGGNGSGTTAGSGGAGTASSISGSSVTYAGGGGAAGAFSGSTAGTGGSGGGGNGNASGNGTSGTANLGGGGGGACVIGSSGLGGSGGSGIVIISYTATAPKFVGGTITTSGGKQIHTFTSSGTLTPVTEVTASYLVVAGGGGAVGNRSGGGGAGGLLTGSTTLYNPATYIVTVGAGGAGGAGNAGVTSTQDGSNSVLSGTGLTTITATGGGGGGGTNNPSSGRSGGSGGGAGGDNATGATGGTGTSGQGFAGGSSATNGGGGGGGASAIGSNGATAVGGNGGAGTASSISGTSVTYAGGGGGGANTTAGTGGAGGGGNGAQGSPTTQLSGVSGTQNLGGGAGGGSNYSSTPVTQASGGSGVVIISYAGSQVFNGGTVTTSGGNTIHTFYATGALTPITNNLTNSLRFRSSASAYLNKTFVTPTDNKKWTYSGWVKRGTLGSASQQHFFNYWTGGTAQAGILFSATTDTIEFFDYTGSYGYQLVTTQVFRDPSAWYHFVIAVDTTQATSSNRIKMYVNGNQITAFSTSTYPSLNYNTLINSANAHYIGRRGDAAGYFDGYMTDVYFIDGQALEPYYFGSNDSNNVWKPIKYYGTYGTNGFYLTFGNTTSTTTLGYDSSPNGNNWTTNNISLTAGTTYDAMTDVPTLTSATAANYAVMNPVFKASSQPTFSNANLTLSPNAATYQTSASTINVTSGKWYVEFTTNGTPNSANIIGISSLSELNTMVNTATYPGNTSTGWGFQMGVPNKLNNNITVSYGSIPSSGGVIMMAFDLDNGKIWWGLNGTWFSSGDPAAGTNYAYNGISGSDGYSVTVTSYSGGLTSISLNFGQRPFSYTPPTGFVALNTYNLPTPTIIQGNRFMDATLWTGNNTSRSISNTAPFKPDLVWIKSRSNAEWNIWFDSVRGVGKSIYSNSTNVEVTNAGSGYVSAFNSDGFSVVAGSSDSANVNATGYTYVGWQWQAGQGSTSSNTSGSITSTVSVNATAGFSIVTYTGTGANATVGHGLGVAPKFIITKCRGASANWGVYHASLGNTKADFLNLDTGSATSSTYWNNTSPTSSVFSVGSSNITNAANTMVAYCWAEIDGFSKIGSYTGNNNADGPFIYTGFRPKFIMIVDAGGNNWYSLDSVRNTYNAVGNYLFPNTSGAESNLTGSYPLDFLSNGFKIRNASYPNGTATNLYIAFASNPFKYDNAR